MVEEDKVSTKVRILYGTSAKHKGPSLNESLYERAFITLILFNILLCFRIHQNALTGDIEVAYLQVSVTVISVLLVPSLS